MAGGTGAGLRSRLLRLGRRLLRLRRRPLCLPARLAVHHLRDVLRCRQLLLLLGRCSTRHTAGTLRWQAEQLLEAAILLLRRGLILLLLVLLLGGLAG